MKSVILIGGGYSIKEGIEKGLWEKIKSQEIWSLNYAFMTMPYLPKREVWLDNHFFRFNVTKLQELYKQGVEMISKEHTMYAGLPEVKQIPYTRVADEFFAKCYVGGLGLTGVFALSLAVREEYDIIYLLGYDFGSHDGKDKHTHYYQEYLPIVSSGVQRPEVYYLNDRLHESLQDFALYTNDKIKSKIYNVSLISHIPYYDKISWEEFFQILEKSTT